VTHQSDRPFKTTKNAESPNNAFAVLSKSLQRYIQTTVLSQKVIEQTLAACYDAHEDNKQFATMPAKSAKILEGHYKAICSKTLHMEHLGVTAAWSGDDPLCGQCDPMPAVAAAAAWQLRTGSPLCSGKTATHTPPG